MALLATLAVYHPAWHGGLLWDDDAHVTSAALRTADGLRRIWFDIGATQQYYPLVHSAFWLMHRLWGDRTVGYHVCPFRVSFVADHFQCLARLAIIPID